MLFAGIVLIILGALLVLERLGIIYGDVWDIFWPTILIALGISMLWEDRRNKRKSAK
jgi:hypothetical protein